jgi:hypothetical protein
VKRCLRLASAAIFIARADTDDTKHLTARHPDNTERG